MSAEPSTAGSLAVFMSSEGHPFAEITEAVREALKEAAQRVDDAWAKHKRGAYCSAGWEPCRRCFGFKRSRAAILAPLSSEGKETT